MKEHNGLIVVSYTYPVMPKHLQIETSEVALVCKLVGLVKGMTKLAVMQLNEETLTSQIVDEQRTNVLSLVLKTETLDSYYQIEGMTHLALSLSELNAALSTIDTDNSMRLYIHSRNPDEVMIQERGSRSNAFGLSQCCLASQDCSGSTQGIRDYECTHSYNMPCEDVKTIYNTVARIKGPLGNDSCITFKCEEDLIAISIINRTDTTTPQWSNTYTCAVCQPGEGAVTVSISLSQLALMVKVAGMCETLDWEVGNGKPLRVSFAIGKLGYGVLHHIPLKVNELLSSAE